MSDQDAPPRLEDVQITLIREAPVSKRLRAVASLVKTTRRLSWQGLSLRVIKVQGGQLDAEYLERWSRSLGLYDLLQKALREA